MATEDAFLADWIQDVWDKGFPQVQKELVSYWDLLVSYWDLVAVHSKLLDRVTKGRMSKTNYTWEAIEEVLNRIEQEDGI